MMINAYCHKQPLLLARLLPKTVLVTKMESLFFESSDKNSEISRNLLWTGGLYDEKNIASVQKFVLATKQWSAFAMTRPKCFGSFTLKLKAHFHGRWYLVISRKINIP